MNCGLTEKQIEIAARKLCELSGRKPDDWVATANLDGITAIDFAKDDIQRVAPLVIAVIYAINQSDDEGDES